MTVNGRTGKPAHRVEAGDRIEVDEPPPRPLDTAAEDIPLDDRLRGRRPAGDLDKPAGLVIHPAAGNPSGTLVNALLQHCDDLSGIGGAERPGIVHRLDKDTSGLLVVAKNDSAHLRSVAAFRRRRDDQDLPRDLLRRAGSGRRRRRRPRSLATRASASGWRWWHRAGRPGPSTRSAEPLHGAALIRCRLITGRTHQIRVHMAHAGHALVGDPLYAGRQWRNLTDPRSPRRLPQLPPSGPARLATRFHPSRHRRGDGVRGPSSGRFPAALFTLQRAIQNPKSRTRF